MWDDKDKNTVVGIFVELAKEIRDGKFRYTIKGQILIRELIALSKHDLKYPVVIQTLLHMENEADKLNTFTQHYKQYLHKYNKLNEKEWKVILPFDNPVIQTKFRILGQDFKIAGKRAFNQLVNMEELQKIMNLRYDFKGKKFQVPAQILITTVNGGDVIACWQNLRTKFGILQGVYDYGLINGMWRNTRASMTRFKHPDWMIMISPTGDHELGSFMVPNEVIKSPIDFKRVPALKQLLKFVRDDFDNNTTKSLIYNSFRLYGQAMESIYNYNCFLSLWQLLENVCISEKMGGNTSDTIRRIEVIVEETKSPNVIMKGIYKSLAQKRNDLVHKGIDRTDKDDANILKILAESAIKWLFAKQLHLTTKTHINEYFSLRTKPESEKKAIVETIKYLSPDKKK